MIAARRHTKDTLPKLCYLPPRPFLENYVVHSVPVDACANIHISTLALMLGSPEKDFIGSKVHLLESDVWTGRGCCVRNCNDNQRCDVNCSVLARSQNLVAFQTVHSIVTT